MPNQTYAHIQDTETQIAPYDEEGADIKSLFIGAFD